MVVWSRFYLYQNYQGLEYYLSHRCIVLSPININEKGGPHFHISQLHPSKWIVSKFDNIFSDVVVTTNVQSNVANTAIMCRHNGELDNKASSSSNWQKSQGICFDKPATINIFTIFTLFWLGVLPQSNLSYLLNADRIQKAIDLERFAIRLPCPFFVSVFSYIPWYI